MRPPQVMLHTAPLAQCVAVWRQHGIPGATPVLVACRELSTAELALLEGWQVIIFAVPRQRWHRNYARLFRARVGEAEQYVAPYAGCGFPGADFANVARFLYLLGSPAYACDCDGALHRITWRHWQQHRLASGADRLLAGVLLGAAFLLRGDLE